MTMHGDDFDPFVPGAARSVSLVQAGQMLGISRRTLYYWIRDGRLHTLRTPMGSQRILMESIRSHWLERF
ncbi:MAG: helix-turn-helix domain-containing protein [Acidobacteria bacterium]|jgi:excisionase family DNA binding protein|nr:helix-turn-helix domain-containing protein [Acidobacteriota bacterium]